MARTLYSLIYIIICSSAVSAIFEVATLEHFLRPPVQYEVSENPYACNDVPPTESGVISYFLIRKTTVHPRIIAFYKSTNPFTAACTEDNLISITSFFPEANTQQVVLPSDPYITHWKALSTASPEWEFYVSRDLSPGEAIQWSVFLQTWRRSSAAVDVQNYDYNWEDIEGRRRRIWVAGDLYPPSDSAQDDDSESDGDSESDSLDASSDPNDFQFAFGDIDNHDADTMAEEDQVESGGGDLYNMLIESTPEQWPMEEEPAPVSTPTPTPMVNIISRPDPQMVSDGHRPNANNRRREHYLENLVHGRQIQIQLETREARERNRLMQRTGTYVPLPATIRQRPYDELVALGYYIDPIAEEMAEAERRRREAQIAANDDSARVVLELESNQFSADHPHAEILGQQHASNPPLNTEPPLQGTNSFLNPQQGGYTADVDKFFDFRREYR